MGTLYVDLSTFMIICHSVLLRMRKISDKSCRENQNTHFMFSNPAHHPKVEALMK